jgi:hypothetical protein
MPPPEERENPYQFPLDKNEILLNSETIRRLIMAVKKIGIIVALLFALGKTDPVVPTVFNEIQTAPDSLQQLEFKLEFGELAIIDSITTHMGTWKLNWQMLWDEYRIFRFPKDSLNKNNDTITVYWNYGTSFECGDRVYCSTQWPPEGMSLSLLWFKGVRGMDENTWYIDPTPTFEAPNDNWGMITGLIFDGADKPIDDSLHPKVFAAGGMHTYETYSSVFTYPWPPGSYVLVVTAGKYQLSAQANGYETQLYPDSVEVASGDTVTGIDFKLAPRGIKESQDRFRNGISLVTSANPAGSNIEIKFQIPELQTVKLTVYDGIGRPVRTIVDGKTRAGEHQIRWDGKNQSGQRVPSGLYFITLNAGTSALTKKIAIVK